MIILGTNSIKDTGFDVANSLRFNRGSSDYLNRTATSGNRQVATFSGWLKKGTNGDDTGTFQEYNNGTNFFEIRWRDADNLRIYEELNGSTGFELITNRLFRDPSAWYHIAVIIKTTEGTAANRIKLYVNGVQETSFATETYPAQNYNVQMNVANKVKYIGSYAGTSNFYDGYKSEIVWLDGTAAAITDLGEFDEDSGIWKPIDVSGLTFGTNGFYLDFEDSSALGNDAAGSNNFTVNNLTATDQSTDTCTNNFCTLNPLDNFYQGATFSEGNLLIATASSPYTYNTANMGMSSGKWYWEGKALSVGSGNSAFGIISTVSTSTSDEAPLKTDSAMYKDSGVVRRNNGNGTSIGSVSNNDIVSFAYDADNNFIYFALNGTWQNSGDPTSGASGTGGYDPGNVPASTATGFYFPMFSDHNSGSGYSMSFNFGSPQFAISSGNTDGNGYGNFEYAVPSSYYSLNTKNLAEHGG